MSRFRLDRLAELLGARLEGDGALPVEGIASLEQAAAGQLSFLANPRYLELLARTRAGAVLLREEDLEHLPAGAAALVVRDPYLEFARALELYHPAPAYEQRGRHPSAVVDPDSDIHPETWIGPFVHIERGCVVGRGSRILAACTLYENVVLGEDCLLHGGCQIRENCRLGDRVVLQNGVVVGSEGFGFTPDGRGGLRKIPQTGDVILEDDVEIGANSCVDRATMGSTVVERGTKLDNLVQVAHNVRIGEHTVMAALSGIAGSSEVGRHCKIGGGVSISGHLRVGDRVQVGGRSAVIGSISDDRTVAGFPARDHGDFLKQGAALASLPDLLRKVRRLEGRIAELESLLRRAESGGGEPERKP